MRALTSMQAKTKGPATAGRWRAGIQAGALPRVGLPHLYFVLMNVCAVSEHLSTGPAGGH